jgi:hypothetical protein
MKNSITILLAFFTLATMQAQTEKTEKLPYYEIPAAPEKATANGILARMIDGLGFRYYWATEGLVQDDLDFTPGNHGRKTQEVLDHLYGLSDMIKNTVAMQPNVRPREEKDLTWEETRRETLLNIKAASDFLRTEKGSPEDYKIVFQRGEKTSEFPMWHLLNGPLADALTHVGQVVSYRRSAGNPVNPNVNVFMGVTKE